MSHLSTVESDATYMLQTLEDGSTIYHYVCKNGTDTASLPADDLMLDLMVDWPHPFVVEVKEDNRGNKVLSVVYGGDKKTTLASCENYLASLVDAATALQAWEEAHDVGGGGGSPIGVGGH
jgi:hypothetical protein